MHGSIKLLITIYKSSIMSSCVIAIHHYTLIDGQHIKVILLSVIMLTPTYSLSVTSVFLCQSSTSILGTPDRMRENSFGVNTCIHLWGITYGSEWQEVWPHMHASIQGCMFMNRSGLLYSNLEELAQQNSLLLRLTFQKPLKKDPNSSCMAASSLKRDTWLTYSCW